MNLNQMKPAAGSKPTKMRVGRGQGCGMGKTCGRGHKGQHARAGGYHKVGFEGGQMPLQRRMPKSGFVSRKSLCSRSVRLSELNAIKNVEVTLQSLHEAGVIRHDIKYVKIFASGKLQHPVTVRGVPVSKGARAAIEAAGGKVHEQE